ncbi:MAG: hypothetical protein IPF98_02780 [Gemmatimonadetes bacterium]|nr:hypothetical protein [Gemmatimonadota bacterium]
MDQVRYVLAVLVLVSVPPALGLWFAVHPFARFWRRLGPVVSYAILLTPTAALAWALWTSRARLLGRDYHGQPWLMALAAAAALTAIWLQLKRRKHLTMSILAGVPEMSRSDRGQLLTEVIYGSIRHPRYIEFTLFVLAYAAVANYAGTWIVWLLG